MKVDSKIYFKHFLFMWLLKWSNQLRFIFVNETISDLFRYKLLLWTETDWNIFFYQETVRRRHHKKFANFRQNLYYKKLKYFCIQLFKSESHNSSKIKEAFFIFLLRYPVHTWLWSKVIIGIEMNESNEYAYSSIFYFDTLVNSNE